MTSTSLFAMMMNHT